VRRQWRYWRLRPYRRDKTRELANGVGINLAAYRIQPAGEGARLSLIHWIWIGVPLMVLSYMFWNELWRPEAAGA